MNKEHNDAFEQFVHTQYPSEENHKEFQDRSFRITQKRSDITLDFFKENGIKYMQGPTSLHFHGLNRFIIEAKTYAVNQHDFKQFIKSFAYVYIANSEMVRGVLKETIDDLTYENFNRVDAVRKREQQKIIEHAVAKLNLHEVQKELEDNLGCKCELDFKFELGVKMHYEDATRYIKVESDIININFDI